MTTPRRRTRQIAGTSAAAPADDYLADDSVEDVPRVVVDDEDEEPELEDWAIDWGNT